MSRKPTRVPGEQPATAPDDAAPQAASAATGELPNEIDVDVGAIDGPVLTKQGWVVPPGKPNPNAPR
jgi:hypothetical protein